MPEAPQEKVHPHPARHRGGPTIIVAGSRTAYVELQVTTNFTFLTGASHPEEYVIAAASWGHRAVAVTDVNTLAGVVRAHAAAKEVGIPLVVGCRLTFANAAGLSVLAYPTDLTSYGRLCRLLTLGKRRAPKGQCLLRLDDLIEHADGLLAVAVVPDPVEGQSVESVRLLRRVFGDRLSLAASCPYGPDDRGRLRRLADLSGHARVPLVATNDAQYHAPGRRMLHDVLACVRLGRTLHAAGTRLLPNAERHLKPPEEMARLFADHPRAVCRTVEIAEQARGFNLDQLRYEYPSEVVPAGTTAMRHLAALTWQGAADRYPDGLPPKVRAQVEHELALIDELRYAHYFLTVHDLVRFARGEGILCQGRGAAANSAVCYCLGVTSVDPARIDVLFERFVSRERGEPPDIDIDFEHERREEVIQYIYRKYGRDRAALTAEVISYRGRSAVREVGKALGLSLDAVDRLAQTISWWGGRTPDPAELRQLGFDPHDRTIGHLARLAADIQGFPRHLSQHVGGFVITQRPLCELVPIENAAMEDRTVIEWDKDDIDALNMLKVDVLGLGMLTCLRKCFAEVERHHGEALTLATVPANDPATYAMVQRADTVGVFQIESRAQMSMLPRLKPACFYDLVIEVAIVRPGPIQGDMVHPYLRRRDGTEPETYADDTMRRILGKTKGVPLFQEQAMQLAIHGAGFTPDEADKLRRAVTGFRRHGDIEAFGEKFVGGMLARGYDRAFAERCFKQIQGFSTYGFPESHAASFALLAYATSYLKCHYPAAFACALLNSQPMGFYRPAQIVRDAQDHGVIVLPVDVNHSAWDCALAGPAAAPSLRLGMRLVKGLGASDAARIAEAAGRHGPFASVEALWRASGASGRSIRALAAADAFGSMGLHRQAALWQAQKLRDAPTPLFDAAAEPVQDEDAVRLPAVPELTKVLQDYDRTGLSLKRHPIAFLRPWLDRRLVARCAELRDGARWPHKTPVAVAGVCLVRQRPGTAKGITFMTVEDETGVANLVVHPRTFDRHRPIARDANAMLALGRVERQGQVVHVVVRRLIDLDAHLRHELGSQSRNFR